jgi:hypothetical protein
MSLWSPGPVRSSPEPVLSSPESVLSSPEPVEGRDAALRQAQPKLGPHETTKACLI